MPLTTNKFQDFSEQLVRGIHDWDAHTFKVFLVNETPSASLDAVKADLTEIAATGGYTSQTTTITISETSGTTTVNGTQVAWTASGAAIPQFTHAVLFNDTAASDNLICYWATGTINLAAGESYTLKFNNASPGKLFDLV